MRKKHVILTLLLISLALLWLARSVSATPNYQFITETTGYEIDYLETVHINVEINNTGDTSETATIQTSVTMPLAFIGNIEYSISDTEVTLAPSEATTILVTVTGTRSGGADLHLSLYYDGEMQDSITLSFNIGTPGMYFIPGFPVESILITLALTLTAAILIHRKQ